MTLHTFVGELYLGDKEHGNQMIYKTLGGAGGGYLIVNSRHVDIDGLIAANGMPPDERFDRGSGDSYLLVTCIYKYN
ncbi:hypothetical protein DPMN_117917 [Dreissena polymorpha]|uniref:Uncharacterized protein n=1 Tax=Dreissena polymorpha TaxID=45954 RepID=A0A9D4GJ38_DREPO|nr:hypothetical protein DPMN_117917 [Dreissena polymorpha]